MILSGKFIILFSESYSLLKTRTLILLFLVFLPAKVRAASLEPKLDPIALYGNDIMFEVERSGQTVGHHKTEFAVKNGILLVSNTLSIEIKIIFINAFRFLYNSHAAWARGKLQELTVTVDDNGSTFLLNANRDADGLKIESANGSFRISEIVFPTNHWNAKVLGQSKVLNTLTGRINQVRIDAVGKEPIMTERGKVMATKYLFSGELENTVWYDGAGRWVKMKFEGRDGIPITYNCRRCQGGAFWP